MDGCWYVGQRRSAICCFACSDQRYSTLDHFNSLSSCVLPLTIGVFQMSIVLPQAIAPAASTSLFSLSIRNHHLAGGNLVWIIFFVLGSSPIQSSFSMPALLTVSMTLVACIAALQSLTLREPTFDWRADAALKKGFAVQDGDED